jgi:hypothetical protein
VDQNEIVDLLVEKLLLILMVDFEDIEVELFLVKILQK